MGENETQRSPESEEEPNLNNDGQIKSINDKVGQLDTLVKVGFYVLVITVSALVISVVLFEIQTINQANQQNTLLLQVISEKVKN
jgi:hypothetical protein